MKPLISVVSPSWNQGTFIEECIRSVGASGDGIIEHIIIDNCSTDQTAEILEKYPHIVVIREPDSGQSNALNKGFRLAKADWIVWLNVDDFLEPGCIDNYRELLDGKDPDFDVLYGHTRFVDEQSHLIKIVYQPQWHYWHATNGTFVPPTSGTLFRKSRLIQAPLDEDFHMIMDSEWFLRNGSNLRVRRLRKTLSAFRVSDNNKTSQHIQKGECTPRHLKERTTLAEKYQCYGAYVENRLSCLARWRSRACRRLIRLSILMDKFISKFITRK